MDEKTITEIFEKYKGTYEEAVLLYAHFPIALDLRPCAQVQWLDFQPEQKPNKIDKNPNTGALILYTWTDEEKEIGNKLGLEYALYWPVISGERSLSTRRYYAIPAYNKRLIDLIQNLPDGEENVELHGKLHKYPSCCTNIFTEDAKCHVMPDIRAQEQLKLAREKSRPVEVFAYFAKGFVPCKPNCEAATAMGKKIYNTYATFNQEIADAYLKFVQMHVNAIENINLKEQANQIKELNQ